MVAGYPARTYRWLSGAEIDYAQNSDYPRRIRTNSEVLRILKQSSKAIVTSIQRSKDESFALATKHKTERAT